MFLFLWFQLVHGVSKGKFREYITDYWNLIDVTIYSMFVIAIFLRMFHDTREAGRIILATDLFVLYFRLLEALTIFSSLGPKVLMIFKMVSISVTNAAELGYFEIACCVSKYCWVGGLKLGYFFIGLPAAALFSSNLPVSCLFREFSSLFNVQEHSFQICQFPVYSESFRAFSMSKNILFINFRKDVLESNWYTI